MVSQAESKAGEHASGRHLMEGAVLVLTALRHGHLQVSPAGMGALHMDPPSMVGKCWLG